MKSTFVILMIKISLIFSYHEIDKCHFDDMKTFSFFISDNFLKWRLFSKEVTMFFFRKWSFLLAVPLFLLILTCCRETSSNSNGQKVLRISCESEPFSLDPRRNRDLGSVTTIQMLYEGLTYYDDQGRPQPALAEEIVISPDQKHYIFKLKTSYWSNGQKVTAFDFERSWKSTLEPDFPSPNAYQLYVIKNGQAAKEGKAHIESVGVRALDDSTLEVELEQPTPYFLHLTACHFCFPVHGSLRHHPLKSAPSIDDADVVTNGPFKLVSWKRQDELIAEPNPYYWNRDNIRLDRISLIMLDNATSLQSYQQGSLDWIGSPLSALSPETLDTLKKTGQLEITPAAGVSFMRINTEKDLLKNPKIRNALAMALNREELVEHVLQGNQRTAFGLIPNNEHSPYFRDNMGEAARELFKQGLQEQGRDDKEPFQITISYGSTERAHKVAQVVQQQWKQALGIDVKLNRCEGKTFTEKLMNHDYDVGIGSWFADIRDSINFLEVFKFKDNGTNNTQWESPRFIALLNESTSTDNKKMREDKLKEAEKVFIDEMPVIPLFYDSYNFVKRPEVKGVYFSDLGYLDFRQAYIQSTVPAENETRAGCKLPSGSFCSSSVALATNSSQNEPADSLRSAGFSFLSGTTDIQ